MLLCLCSSNRTSTYSFTVYAIYPATDIIHGKGLKTAHPISHVLCWGACQRLRNRQKPRALLLALLEPVLLQNYNRYKERDLYCLFEQSGGSLQDGNSEYVTEQHAGTSALKVLLAVVRSEVPRSAYKHIKLEIRVITILARLVASFSDRDCTVSYSDYFTMKKAIENVGRSACKMLDEGRGPDRGALNPKQVPKLLDLLSQLNRTTSL